MITEINTGLTVYLLKKNNEECYQYSDEEGNTHESKFLTFKLFRSELTDMNISVDRKSVV